MIKRIIKRFLKSSTNKSTKKTVISKPKAVKPKQSKPKQSKPKQPPKPKGPLFKDLGLPENILSSLTKNGYIELTPIQEKTYPLVAAGKDICGLAETGSGKTAACVIPTIQNIDDSLNAIQALIIVPTRELCLQYVTEIMKIAENTKITSFAVYGGSDKEIQVAKINHGVQVLVATPGRLIDLIYDGIITFSSVKTLILDEADELLDEGFLEDIEFLMSCLINKHQTLMFSATMADEIKELADKYMNSPEFVTLISDRPTPKSIKHYFANLPHTRKLSKFLELVNHEEIEQAIIFCNSRVGVDKIYRSIKSKLDNCEYIHGGLNQDVRSNIFWKFKNKKIRFLITTDVTGRGVDFTYVTHVFNWDLPNAIEQYTHRTGRTGRMGKEGKAITFVTKNELHNLTRIIKDKEIKAIWLGHNPLLSDIPDKFQTRKKKVHSGTSNYKGNKKAPYSGNNNRNKKDHK